MYSLVMRLAASQQFSQPAGVFPAGRTLASTWQVEDAGVRSTLSRRWRQVFATVTPASKDARATPASKVCQAAASVLRR